MKSKSVIPSTIDFFLEWDIIIVKNILKILVDNDIVEVQKFTTQKQIYNDT
jgi:hypothetical protein